MNLELHHFFILVKPSGEVADLLSLLGMPEGTRNKHEGQGTSNRRFNFSNGTLEILWVHDVQEAMDGPGRDMFFPERVGSPTACPFGLIFNRKDNADRLSIEHGEEHLMEVTFNENQLGRSKDFRPNLPLIVRW